MAGVIDSILGLPCWLTCQMAGVILIEGMLGLPCWTPCQTPGVIALTNTRAAFLATLSDAWCYKMNTKAAMMDTVRRLVL